MCHVGRREVEKNTSLPLSPSFQLPRGPATSSISCVHVVFCVDSDNVEGPCPSSSDFLSFEGYTHEMSFSVQIKKR